MHNHYLRVIGVAFRIHITHLFIRCPSDREPLVLSSHRTQKKVCFCLTNGLIYLLIRSVQLLPQLESSMEQQHAKFPVYRQSTLHESRWSVIDYQKDLLALITFIEMNGQCKVYHFLQEPKCFKAKNRIVILIVIRLRPLFFQKISNRNKVCTCAFEQTQIMSQAWDTVVRGAN